MANERAANRANPNEPGEFRRASASVAKHRCERSRTWAMETNEIDDSQCKAARVVGFTYLLINGVGLLNEIVIRGRLIDWSNASHTAANIAASETLFRISIVGDIIVFMCDVVLAAAFYLLLKRVDRGLTLAGSFFRLADAAILGAGVLCSFLALRLISGGDHLRAFQPEQLHDLARLYLGAYESGYLIGLAFLGVSSACTSYVLFKARFLPRWLAGWGVFSALVLVTMDLAIIVSPRIGDLVSQAYLLPILTFEVIAGAWLLVRGLLRSTPA
jgi:hypothetical protein